MGVGASVAAGSGVAVSSIPVGRGSEVRLGRDVPSAVGVASRVGTGVSMGVEVSGVASSVGTGVPVGVIVSEGTGVSVGIGVPVGVGVGVGVSVGDGGVGMGCGVGPVSSDKFIAMNPLASMDTLSCDEHGEQSALEDEMVTLLVHVPTPSALTRTSSKPAWLSESVDGCCTPSISEQGPLRLSTITTS
jgi:hypothetical protein